MKIAYFPDQMALQSEPVWQAVLTGLQLLGHEPVKNALTADAVVIWSVLWHGRLRTNLATYNHYRQQNKPVFVIEVGSLIRGKTWKISLNNITNEGIYPSGIIEPKRDIKLGLKLHPIKENRSNRILIAAQHQSSLQWKGLPTMIDWVNKKIAEVRKVTDMPIVVRPHPRFRIGEFTGKRITTDVPNKIPNTYDSYNLNYNFQFIINHNSGVGIQSVIHGTPVIVDSSSLAYPMTMTLSDIDTPKIPDRQEWFQKILHTEWLVDELAAGIPQERLLKELTF
jgi:hypothetical protein